MYSLAIATGEKGNGAGRNPSSIGTFFPVVLLAIAFGMNHAGVIAGVNISIADAFLPIALLILAVNRQLLLPRPAVTICLSIMVVACATGAFISPLKYGYIVEARGLIVELLKFSALAGYLVLSYNLSRLGLLGYFLKRFALGATVLSIAGTITYLVPTGLGLELLYYQASRFSGLFEDPNYQATVSVCSLAIVLAYRKQISVYWKPVSAVLVVGLLLTGSKTGGIALVVFVLWVFVQTWNGEDRTNDQRSTRILYFIGLSALTAILISLFREAIVEIVRGNVSFGRIALAFTDPQEALNAQGSGRQDAWRVGVDIILQNPIQGIGFSAYQEVATELSGRGVIAHNTYLQIASEWGLILAILAIGAVGLLMLRSIEIKQVDALVARHILFVIAIASVSISLNNFRLAWIAIGVLSFVHLRPRYATAQAEQSA